MSQIGDGFVFIEKTEQEDVFKSRQINIMNDKQQTLQKNQLMEQQENQQDSSQSHKEEKKTLLKGDANIISLSENKQVQRKLFNKTSFLRDVKKLNKEARGVDPERMAEKGHLVKDLFRIRQMKVNGHKLPSDIRDVLSLLNDYTVISCTAKENAHQRGYSMFGVIWWAIKVALNFTGNRSTITKEHELLAKMLKKLDKVIANYDTNDHPEYADVMTELKNLRTKLTTQSGAVRTDKDAEGNTENARYKKKWDDYSPESRKINGVGRKIQTTADVPEFFMKKILEVNVTRDRTDWPLFAHRPTYEDVCQGAAGNCFFLAALASIPSDKIRDMMLDNGNGTVTVRFYDKNPVTGKREPVYVTVDKKVKINASLDCFWVQIMEKAYSLFRQTRSDNKMLLENGTTTDSVTGEVTEGKEITIAQNAIDLGYLANGGQSRDVLSDLLGVDSEYIDINESAYDNSISDICRNALQNSDPVGAALLEIKRLQTRFDSMKSRLEKLIRIKGMHLNDFKTYELEVATKKETIRDLEIEIREATDPVTIKELKAALDKHLKQLADMEREVAPIKGLLYEYYNAKKQTDDKIQALKNEHGIKDIKANERHFAKINPYGIQQELAQATSKIMNILDSRKYFDDVVDGRDEELRQGTINGIESAFSELIDEYIADVAKNRKMDVDTATVKDYELLIRDALNGVKESGSAFLKYTNDPSKLYIILDSAEKATEIAKEFMVPVLEKMLKNIWQVDGIQRSLEFGEDDPIATYYFDKLTSMVRNKQCVCIGTREVEGDEGGVAGEGMLKGMVGSHAYTVLDTKQTNDGARLVKLRNPWAAYVVDYKQNKKGLLENFATEEESNGIFWIEMNHLMKYLEDIHGSGKPEAA